ncbi:MAG: molybdopterin molybdotransferase MoeA [Candidatus Odinarchaeota archaeon]|nr:molybdopterin molybdotransferase MoeA [Candidatus Odinarchaeota archaeon]
MSVDHIMRGFKSLITLDEALKRIDKEVKPITDKERIKIDKASWRVAAEDIIAPINNPPFDRSTVDGYAVRFEDVISASSSNPVVIELIGESLPGKPFEGALSAYQGVYVSTGAKMPKGANAVVPVEYTRKVDNNKVAILRSVSSGENVSILGEDIKKGDVILEKGTIIFPHNLAYLVSAKITEVLVYRKTKIGVIVTGSEIISPFDEMTEEKIIDSLSYLIPSMFNLNAFGFHHFGRVSDDEIEIEKCIKQGLEYADVLIITGGTSVGKADMSSKIVSNLEGSKKLFHGVSIQPGKPVGIYKIGSGKFIVLLPGYPVSAYFCLIKIVKPLLLKIQGVKKVFYHEPIIKAVLRRRVSTKLGVRTFVRVKLFKKDEILYADPIHTSGSGLLSTLAKADGYFEVPENLEGVEAGTVVDVKPFETKII